MFLCLQPLTFELIVQLSEEEQNLGLIASVRTNEFFETIGWLCEALFGVYGIGTYRQVLDKYWNMCIKTASLTICRAHVLGLGNYYSDSQRDLSGEAAPLHRPKLPRLFKGEYCNLGCLVSSLFSFLRSSGRPPSHRIYYSIRFQGSLPWVDAWLVVDTCLGSCRWLIYFKHPSWPHLPRIRHAEDAWVAVFTRVPSKALGRMVCKCLAMSGVFNSPVFGPYHCLFNYAATVSNVLSTKCGWDWDQCWTLSHVPRLQL